MAWLGEQSAEHRSASGEIRQVLECGSPLPLSGGCGGENRQRTGAVQDAGARGRALPCVCALPSGRSKLARHPEGWTPCGPGVETQSPPLQCTCCPPMPLPNLKPVQGKGMVGQGHEGDGLAGGSRAPSIVRHRAKSGRFWSAAVPCRFRADAAEKNARTGAAQDAGARGRALPCVCALPSGRSKLARHPEGWTPCGPPSPGTGKAPFQWRFHYLCLRRHSTTRCCRRGRFRLYLDRALVFLCR
jgi:hypothetical protein